MSTYVGPLGGLVKTPALNALQEIPYRRDIWHEGIDGSPSVTRVGKQWREWICDLPLIEPRHVATLRDLAAYQTDYYWLVTDAAQRQNLLTPDAAVWRDWQVDWSAPTIPPKLTRAGPVMTADGRAQSSALFDYDGDTWAYQSPVVPVDPDGTAAVAAVYVRAFPGKTAQVRIVWTDGSGSDLGSGYVTESTTNATSPLVRVVAQGTPPPGAAGYRIQVRRAVQAAWPTAQWGQLGPRTDGKGAQRVVLSPVPESVVLLARARHLATYSYSIKEVR